MATQRSDLTPARLLEPGLRKVFNDVGREHEPEYTRIFNVLTSQRQFEEDSQFVFFGTVPRKVEGEPATLDDPVANANQQRYLHLGYGLVVRFTHEAVMDELYGQLSGAGRSRGGRIARAMSRSVNNAVEQVSANFFNLGFTTETDINNIPIFETGGLHVKLDGSTFNNETALPFGFTNWQTASDYFETSTNDRSLVMAMQARQLIIPPQLEWLATEVFKTTSGRPFTADNTVNAVREVRGGVPDIVVSHYLTSTTAWFVIGDNKEEHAPNFFWREKPSFASDDEFMSLDVLNRTYLRFSIGATIAQGMWGSTGV